MKHFVIFLIFAVIGVCCLVDLGIVSSSKTGARFELFKIITIDATPPILANYLRQVSVHYSVYKIPNYIHEFMASNKSFSYVYKSNDKFTILIFKPQKQVSIRNSGYNYFYNKLKTLVNTEYKDTFNIIIVDEFQESIFLQSPNEVTYNHLKKYCGSFCLIDPVKDSMFVFKKISNTEAEALEVLLQQYYFLRKNGASNF